MIPEQTPPVQLSLRFQPLPITQMTQEEQAAALNALAQLLLSAAGARMEEMSDEH